MDLTDRFRYIMKLNNLTASAFADEIGVQRSSVSHILSGRNKPSLEFIQKVIHKYPKVDIGWLINGSVSISNKKEIESQEEQEIKPIKKVVEKMVGVKKTADQPKTVVRVLIFFSDNTFEEFQS